MFGISHTKDQLRHATTWLGHCAFGRANAIDQFVGNRLRSIRVQSGIPIAFIATSVGVSDKTFGRFEAGRQRISAQQLFALAKCFNVPVADFFSHDGATQ
ncbi:helix-turn-helix transcriptional regulator [Asticcacaulis sp.]|uniref:helix-turn-helix domain-containing protein n=1 Tax=Asticcacaulis sp. TaxID=1872648 RepID=UPI002BF879A2|nr:helix-turn-helix transcriptional regulator [Asticcacaulis sp.]HTM82200.1 helix-turn-helix transcriptional regulator [Asticcacaulis sp.]